MSERLILKLLVLLAKVLGPDGSYKLLRECLTEHELKFLNEIVREHQRN